MTAKLYRNNTNFQIAYFIAGKCHTPDAAYVELLNLREDREMALNTAKVNEIRKQAQHLKIQAKLNSKDPIEVLEGRAEQLELDNDELLGKKLVAAAEEELAFINECIDKIQPLRKYKHLSNTEAAEASQREEWLLEFQTRAENYLLTQGTIPTDHFSAMRQHPDFEKALLPHITQAQAFLQSPEGHLKLLAQSPKFDLPKLVGLTGEQ